MNEHRLPPCTCTAAAPCVRAERILAAAALATSPGRRAAVLRAYARHRAPFHAGYRRAVEVIERRAA